MNDTISCEHGNLKRSCYVCELEAQMARLKKVADVATIYAGNIGHSRRCKQVQESHGLYQCFCRYEELRAALAALKEG